MSNSKPVTQNDLSKAIHEATQYTLESFHISMHEYLKENQENFKDALAQALQQQGIQQQIAPLMLMDMSSILPQAQVNPHSNQSSKIEKLNAQIQTAKANSNPIEEIVTKETPFVLPKMCDIRAYIDKEVIGQAEAKKVAVRAVHKHIVRCFCPSNNPTILRKQNVLMIGPSGCGKTSILNAIARFPGFDDKILVKQVDSTSLTPAGFKGKNVNGIAADIYMEAGEDLQKAENCIVFLDEFDKILAKADSQSTGSSVLHDLLKFIEGGKITFQTDPQAPPIVLDTTNILVFVAGAFEGIEQLFEVQRGIGFAAQSGSKPCYNDVVAKVGLKEYMKAGFNPQILGRIPVRTHLKELTEHELVQVQRDTITSIAKQSQKHFACLTQQPILNIADSVMQYIAKEAVARGTGARELDTVYDALLADAYDKVEGDESIRGVNVYMDRGNVAYSYNPRQAKIIIDAEFTE